MKDHRTDKILALHVKDHGSILAPYIVPLILRGMSLEPRARSSSKLRVFKNKEIIKPMFC